MSFLKKLFGPKDPVEEMRQCHSRQDWAGVLVYAKKIDYDTLDEQLCSAITALEHEAGDALAQLNVEEGIWAHKSGNLLRAREDFQLAIEQSRSNEVRERAKQALAALEKGEIPDAAIESSQPTAKQTGCSTCSPATAPNEDAGADLDEETRMELLLAAMDPALADRYLAAGKEFRKAWLTTQDGDEKLALKLFADVPNDERNALFLFEKGSLLARSGQTKQARKDLQAALTLEPGLFPAFDALVEILFASKRLEDLEKQLKQNIAEQRFVGYCWARLAELDANRGKLEPALAAGLKAMEEGVADPELLVLCSQLLEREERFAEAEALLKKLPAGGCGGGAHPILAEYWLRHGQNLNKALESFKSAMRQESDNPRWLLRIAQVYVAKGWHKEATAQVEQLMQSGRLPEHFKAEVNSLADQLQR